MPLFNFYCSACNTYTKRLLDSIKNKDFCCIKCNSPLKREAVPPSFSIKETVDNGLMPKSIERFTDIEEKMKERTENSKKRE